MDSKSATLVHGVSFGQNPRDGQKQVFDQLDKDRLNIKLPTGYGKTFTSFGCYSILKLRGHVDKMLTIVPTTQQRDQLVQDGMSDARMADCFSKYGVRDISDRGAFAIKELRQGADFFVITIQSLLCRGGWELVSELFAMDHKWMLTIDEYHHYGIDKSWGKRASDLPFAFRLAMSATPHRPDDDSAFGPPDVNVTYRQAVKENAVKPLRGHEYVYKLDAVTIDGVKTYTTSELINDVGSDKPDDIEKFRIKHQMRWSPKYVSPLVDHPIQRLIANRIKTGLPLQAIVGAMCVSHAELVCKQIGEMFDLEVDWVGTGPNGRTQAKNREVLKRFCPPKENGNRPWPELDVLVHVGMAGEGMDSTYVSEVVHLNAAGKTNQNDQENGRASRYLPNVFGNINFDSSSGYAGYDGSKMIDAMDNVPASEASNDGDSEPDTDADELDELPDEPMISVVDVELVHILSGDELLTMKEIVVQTVKDFTTSDIESNNKALNDAALRLYKNMKRQEAEQFNDQSVVAQWHAQVQNATSHVAGLVVRMVCAQRGMRFEKTFVGDVKKRINSEKKRQCGPVEKDCETLKRHYNWLKALEKALRDHGEVPSWVM